jgi:recombination protein RecA
VDRSSLQRAIIRLPERSAAPRFALTELSGRLVELSGSSLTAIVRLVREAQLGAEPVAWVSDEKSSFFPPDVAASGVDLDALVVVRVAADHRARAADLLARSGAFGLIVVDCDSDGRVPMPLLSRLLGLAQKHGIAIVFLSGRSESRQVSELGSLVSLRAQVSIERTAAGRFKSRLQVLKDKRCAPGWIDEEVCSGPPGLR